MHTHTDARNNAQQYNNVPLEELLPYIDWNPFFAVWQLRGQYPNRGYPRIFDDETVGAEAKGVRMPAHALNACVRMYAHILLACV